MKNRGQFLVLSRHGQTRANELLETAKDEHFYELTGSDRTAEITDHGVTQMLAAVERIKRFLNGLSVSRIVASSYRRTQHSAEVVADGLGYDEPIEVDERLDKRDYGRFWNVTYKGVRELFPDEHEKLEELGPLAYRPPEGENYFDLFSRVAEALVDISNFAGAVQVLVCHSVVFLATARELEGLTDDEVYRRYETVDVENGEVKVYWRPNVQRPWRLVNIDRVDNLRRFWWLPAGARTRLAA